MGNHECRVRYDPGDRKAPIVHEAALGFPVEAWHQDATADTGEAYSPVGTRYVIACPWCRCVFVAPTRRQAIVLFGYHEREMAADPGPTEAEKIEDALTLLAMRERADEIEEEARDGL